MSDPLTWSPISLGRWFGTTVRVHIILIIFVVFRLLSAAVIAGRRRASSQLSADGCWLGLLLLIALALHELGHAVTAAWLDCDQEDVNIWPLGSLVGPSFVPALERAFPGRDGRAGHQRGDLPGDRPSALNLFAGAQFVWNPFGNDGSGCRCSPELASGDLRHPAQPGLDDRLVRLPELGPDGRQPDPGPAVRRRPDAPRLSWRARRSSPSRDSIARPLDGPGLRPAAGDRRVVRLVTGGRRRGDLDRAWPS